MTIKQQYQKAYRNYLRRLNRQIRQGYIVETIPRVKKPTRASISRLEKQTAKEIKRKASIVDFLTGEVVDKKAKVRKEKTSKLNREFSKLTPEYQEAAINLQTVELQSIKSYVEPTGTPLNTVEHIIGNWYLQLERIHPPEVGQYIINKTNELLYDADKEKRARFAWILDNNPNIIGDYKYLNKQAIDIDFNNLRQVMDWAIDSEDYQEFKSLIEYYEEE